MKALTIGGATVDSIALIASERVERMTMRNAASSFLLLEEGRKTEALEISNHCGGGAVNTAVAMARLGLDVSTIVKLGQDERADTILSKLAAEGVSTRWAARDPSLPTGASVMISSHERDAVIFTFRGANTLLNDKDLRDDAFGVDLVHIAHLSNQSADCFPKIIAKAKANGAFVSTNPGVRQLSSRPEAALDSLPKIDVLSLNRTEADALVPILVGRFGEGGPALPLKRGEQPPAIVARGLSGGGFEISLAQFFIALHKLGLARIILTDGSSGAVASSAAGIVHCPVAPASAVAGTAGAGDAYAATCAAMLAQGASLGEALQAGAVNSASVITHADTQTGLLTAAELKERLAKAQKALRLREWPAPAEAALASA